MALPELLRMISEAASDAWDEAPPQLREVLCSASDGLSEAAGEIDRLLAAVAKMSYRRCHDCGHVAYYLSPAVVHCQCEKCGSVDTRPFRATAESEVNDANS